MANEKELDSLKKEVIKSSNVPKHIAFIMDGNGRWARRRGLPRIAGHHQGVKSVRAMVELGPEIGVDYMTFYTFSTENWKRPKIEVTALMSLLVDSVNRELEDLMKNDVRLHVIGDLSSLPVEPREALMSAIERTSGNKGLKLILAISYSGRREIVNAVNRLLRDQQNRASQTPVGEITEDEFKGYLDTFDYPDPDLMIRTSGEFRLSNFLLWQLAYTEIIVTEKYWPEFDKLELLKCLRDYQRRERRFGKTSDQLKKQN